MEGLRRRLIRTYNAGAARFTSRDEPTFNKATPPTLLVTWPYLLSQTTCPTQRPIGSIRELRIDLTFITGER